MAVLSALTVQAETDSATLERQFKVSVTPFLKSYCLDCHGQEDPAAKLDLSDYSSADAVAKEHQTWAIVLDRLVAGEMPPKNSDAKPTAEEMQAIVEWIKSAREFEAERNAGDPGPVLARRLSNSEYNYSIRDLTGVDIQPTKTFPIDPANEAGFDNTGESLTMSPALLKKYLDAARLVTEHLVLKPEGIAFAPHPVVTDTDRDKYCVKRIVQIYKQQPTDLADYFFVAWQYRLRSRSVSDRSKSGLIPRKDSESGELRSLNYRIRYLHTVSELLEGKDAELNVGPIATLQKTWRALPQELEKTDEASLGCERMRDFVVELRQKLKPDFPMITVEGSHVGSQPFVLWRNRQRAAARRKLDISKLHVEGEPLPEPPARTEPKRGEQRDPNAKSAVVEIDPALVIPADEAERARVIKAFQKFCSVFPDAFYISERGRDYVDQSRKQMGERGRLLSAGFHSMMGYFRDDGPLYDLLLDETGRRELDALWQELDFVTSAPMRQYEGFLWFERTDSRYMRDPQFDFARPENKSSANEEMIAELGKLYLEKARASGGTEVPLQAIEHFFREINEQIRWVENARQKSESSHLAAVQKFASRAFRRELSAAESDGLVSFYQSLRDVDGLSHEEAIQDTIVSVLMSPHFCYRVDLIGMGDGQRPLTAGELASRLSYFLWSSTPDTRLLDMAASGQLTNTEVLTAQVRRMLKDDRVRGLGSEFAANWLDFRRFEEHNAVDRARFPQFDDDLRQAMFEEPIRFFVDVAKQDRSVLEFLDADHTFVNSDLARHYGMQELNSAIDGWRRVDGVNEYGRGGLLSMAVFLTKNAPGLRTSPVKRGYWVVRRLLGERIPPPPPNVPELPNDESKLGELTLREALAKHREHASCAGCHERFDSIGLAFEGFGPVGERRELDLGSRPIDAKAQFPGGPEGTGISGLRDYLMKHRQEEFVDNLVRKLVSYALGRSLILSDELLIRDLHNQLESNEYRFGSLIESIVLSPQFLNKRGSKRLIRE